MLVVRGWEPADVSRCIQVALEAQVPVFASMKKIYGDDLFARLRPDWEAGQAAEIEAWMTSANASGWAAEVDGVVVGFIVTSSDLNTGMGTVEMVAVQPGRQRQGVGGSLVWCALDHLRGTGVVYVQAFIRDFPGHEAALQTFRSHGFARRAVAPTLLYRMTEHPGQPARRPTDVRRVEEADVEACVQFGVDAFRSVYASFDELYGPELFPRIAPEWEQSQAAYIRSAVSDPDDETWVYEVDGRPAGFVVLKMDEQRIADIDLLAVDPTMQSRGIATTLNRFALDRSQEASMKYVIVATADDPGHAPARRSYEQAGFVPMPIQWNPQITHL